MLAHKLDLLQVGDLLWVLGIGFCAGPRESSMLSRMIFGKRADGRDEDVVLPSGWLTIDESVSGVAGAIFLGRPKGEAVDADGDAVVFEPVEEGVNQGFFSKEIVPVAVIEVRGDDGRFPPIAFTHEFKEGIDLFGL